MTQAQQVVALFFQILTWMVFVRVILSWIPHNPHSPFIRPVYEVTEPILSPFRRLMPRSGFPLDLSPFLALIVLRMLQNAIVTLMRNF